MTTLKIDSFMTQPPFSPEGKSYTIHSFQCQGSVDGAPGMFLAKCFNDESAKLVKEGAVIEGCEQKEFKGQLEYILPKVGGGWKGGGGGFKGKTPEERASIVKQCVFKGAVDLVCGDKLDIKQMEKFLDKWVAIIDGQAAKADPNPRPKPAKQEAPADDGDDDLPF